MSVDSHIHLWDRRHTPQPWMTAEHSAITRPFGPSDIAPLLERNGIDVAILVQGAGLDSDTDYLLEEAARHDSIGAVTAWVCLDDSDRAARRLDDLQRSPKLRAVRHLVHNEPDHRPQMARWEIELRSAAAQPNVLAKVSGLNTALNWPAWTAEDLRPVVEVALGCFGPHRLMCGSDWPVALLNGDYDRVWRLMALALALPAPNASNLLLDGNARRAYRLEPPRGT